MRRMSNQCCPSSSQRCKMGRQAHSKSSGPLVPVFTLKRCHCCSVTNRCSACATVSRVRPSGVMTPICSVKATERRKPVVVLFQPGAQVQIVAIHGIGHHPGHSDLCLMHPLHHRVFPAKTSTESRRSQECRRFRSERDLPASDEEDTALGPAA